MPNHMGRDYTTPDPSGLGYEAIFMHEALHCLERTVFLPARIGKSSGLSWRACYLSNE